MYEQDTIAAIATPSGKGAIGVVRVSGIGAVNIARQVFRPVTPIDRWRSHRLYRGVLLSVEKSPLDEALAVWMKAPHSYTGEDVVEFHGHGSPVVLRHFLSHIFACGARPAERGEFTRRAFLNGRLDLAQAEAVLDLIEARTAKGASVAASLLSGGLSRTARELREQLLHTRALVEAQLDFGDEIDLPADEVLGSIARPLALIDQLLTTYRHGSLLREGARVVLVGKPNVGKSSLLNSLLGMDRAIVTEIPGTTRDTIEESLDCEGIPVVLVDTAGLRPDSPLDPVEQIGIERSREALRQADLVLFVADRSQPLSSEDLTIYAEVAEQPHLVVWNKSDLPPATQSNHSLATLRATDAHTVEVSARTGAGLVKLRRAIATMLEGATSGPRGNEPIVTRARHYAVLCQARDALRQASGAIRSNVPLDIVALELTVATDALGALTGEIHSEDVLDQIFQQFCIGK
mgnify:FL=1